MADGFSGRLTELSEFCKFDGNAWTTPDGGGLYWWEEAPYWLKGYIDLGYALGDQRIIGESNRWVEAVLKSRRPERVGGSCLKEWKRPACEWSSTHRRVGERR